MTQTRGPSAPAPAPQVPSVPPGPGQGAGNEPAAPLARLRGFHPGWFGAVMGTAIVGVAAYLNPARTWHLTLLEWADAALFILLAAFWLTVTTRTLRALRTGEAWRPAAPPR